MKKIKWTFILGGIFILLAWAIAYFSRPYLTQFVLQKASATVGAPVEIAYAELSLFKGAVVIHQLKIGDGVSIKKVAVRFDPLALVKGEKTNLSLSLNQPIFHYPNKLVRFMNKEKGSVELPITIETIRVDDGILYYHDSSVGKTITLSQLDVKMRPLSHFSLQGLIDQSASFQIVGNGNLLAKKISFEADAKLEGLPLVPYAPYYENPELPVTITAGNVHLTSKARCQKNHLQAPIHAVIQNLQIKPKKVLVGVAAEKILAELKNDEGNVVLDFLVSGDLLNPQFRITTNVTREFSNALAKVLVKEVPQLIEKVKVLPAEIRSTVETLQKGSVQEKVETGIQKLKGIFGR